MLFGTTPITTVIREANGIQQIQAHDFGCETMMDFKFIFKFYVIYFMA